MLSGVRIMTRGEGDCNVIKSRNGSIQADFLAWKTKFLKRLQALAKGEEKSCSGKSKTEGTCKKKRDEQAEEEEEKAAPQDVPEVPDVVSGRIQICTVWFEINQKKSLCRPFELL